jgi:hypothetical protein
MKRDEPSRHRALHEPDVSGIETKGASHFGHASELDLLKGLRAIMRPLKRLGGVQDTGVSKRKPPCEIPADWRREETEMMQHRAGERLERALEHVEDD